MTLQTNKLFYSKDINNHHTKFHKHDLFIYLLKKCFKDCTVGSARIKTLYDMITKLSCTYQSKIIVYPKWVWNKIMDRVQSSLISGIALGLIYM